MLYKTNIYFLKTYKYISQIRKETLIFSPTRNLSKLIFVEVSCFWDVSPKKNIYILHLPLQSFRGDLNNISNSSNYAEPATPKPAVKIF